MLARYAGVLALLLSFSLGLPRISHADDESHASDTARMAQARERYEAGSRKYAAGDYRGAIVEFRAGYQLYPRPLFLVNIGQAHRQLLEYESARVAYRRYLDEAPASDPVRAQAAELLAEIDRMLDEQKRAATPPEPRAPAPPPVVALDVPIPAPVAPRHWRRHVAWAVPVGVVVIGAIGLGLYYGLRSPSSSSVGCGDATYGCIPVGR